MTTLVLVDDPETMTDALSLARSTERSVEAVTLTAAVADELPAALAEHGIGRLHVLHDPTFADATPETLGAVLNRWLSTRETEAVFAPADGRAAEVLAHAAARARSPLATNCVEITVEPAGSWSLTRTRAGGVLLEQARLTASTKLVTVSKGVPSPEVSALSECVVAEHAAAPRPGESRTRVVERTRAAEGVSLATAPVVVSGGRGVGSADGYAVLEELAGLLGGAVGCSRVATNNGWRPHSDQVGLTGTKVAPQLYLACGISGATQHWVGCMDSQVILAINTDAEAAMVARADYAVIGDVAEVLTAVVSEVESRRRDQVQPPPGAA